MWIEVQGKREGGRGEKCKEEENKARQRREDGRESRARRAREAGQAVGHTYRMQYTKCANAKRRYSVPESQQVSQRLAGWLAAGWLAGWLLSWLAGWLAG